MKRARSVVLLSLLVSILLWSMPVSACGCGVLIKGSNSGWSYGEDSAERSFISYEKGIENLIIGLDIKSSSRNSVLVIPIPSKPTQVKADVLSELPQFNGFNVSDRALTNLRSIRNGILATQLYPLIPLAISSFFLNSLQGAATPGALLNDFGGRGIDSGITVYQHLEKEGMVAEVLTAENSTALYDYLRGKGLQVEKDSIPIFRDYIRDDFSFVVSWIDPTKDTISALGLLMKFPVKEIYYPLKPGSAYSGNGTVKEITIAGYTTPNVYADIKAKTKVQYFYSNTQLLFKDFLSSKRGFGFTKIIINAEPKRLTKDLTITQRAPVKILNAHIISVYPLFYGLLWYVIITFVAVSIGLRSLPVSSFRSSSSARYLRVASLFTIIGAIVGSRKYLIERRAQFVALFSLSLVILTFVILYPMSLLYK